MKSFAETLLGLAEEHTGTVMPGFTHYQPAMITSWGHWLCAYVQGLCRDLERLGFTSGWSIVTRWERLPDSEVPGPSTVN